MDDRALKALDFFPLLDILKGFAISPLGQKRCEALRPSTDFTAIQSRSSEVLELKEILETVGDPPLHGLKEIQGILAKLELEDAVLTVQEFIEIYHQIVLYTKVRRFFEHVEPSTALRLREKASVLSSWKALEKEILRVMNTKGEILDRASPALSDIRARLRETREKVKQSLEHLLHQEERHLVFQEQFITMRNGRYVVLLKADYKHRLPGIVHDQSQSGMSFFFEPLQVVALNNEISILVAEEREEEYRILAHLSTKVRDHLESLWRDYEVLGELDLLYAMARFSTHLKGVQPRLNEKGKIRMEKARHPLLVHQKGDRVVPIHLRLGEGIRTLVISGANAGGKTVALKTLGLLTLMVQCGLPIPVAEGSDAAVFQRISAVIGDEQSIQENVSSFSSHLLHLNQVLETAGPRSLILLDELGVGTHAAEGCALAMGYLDRLREIGATVIVTTHFDRLKMYGYVHPDVENVAVEFDEKTFEPKYTLTYGSSGLSNAFLLAEKLGFSARVLELAQRYQDGGGQEVSEALRLLERLKGEVSREQQELLETKKTVVIERQRLRGAMEEIKKKKQEILSRAEEKMQNATQRAEAELKEWIRQKKEEKKTLQASGSKQRLQELHQIKERIFPSGSRRNPLEESRALSVGDWVKVESLRKEGTLIKVEEPLKRVEVMMGDRKVRTDLSDVVKINRGKDFQEMTVNREVNLSCEETAEPSVQLKVIGLTVEDALPLVDKFIDQALLHGLEKVEIIHGFGSGRLRQAIGQFLSGHKAVRAIAPGEGKRKGAITVVELI